MGKLELLRQVINQEWALLTIGMFLFVNAAGIWAGVRVVTRFTNRLEVYMAEHEILMYAKAKNDGVSREYLRDTATVTARELARLHSTRRHKPKGRSNGAAGGAGGD